jgi:PAS domain S-box-containing protein
MTQVAATPAVYADREDDFSAEFTAKLQQNERLDAESLTTSEFNSSGYDLVLVSDQLENWGRAVDSVSNGATHVVVFSSSPDTLDRAAELGADDCLPRENASFQAERLAKRLSGELSGISQENQHREKQIRRYERLIESDQLILYELDADGYITVASPEFADRMGKDQEDVIGTHVSAYLSDDDIETGNAMLEELAKDTTQDWDSFELSIEDEDDRRWYVNTITPIFNDTGDLCGSMGAMHEITERKEREDELELYEALIRSIPEPVWAVDEQGYFIFANDSYQQFGFASDDVVGTHVKKWFTEEGYERIRRAIFELLSGERIERHVGEYQLGARGASRPFETHLSLIDPGTTDLQGTVGMLRDLTKEKEREQRLNVLNRVFRHNIRNSLTIIKGRAEVLREHGSEREREQAEYIIDEADRLEELSDKAKEAGEILNRKPDRRSREITEMVSPAVGSYEDSGAEIQFSGPDEAQAYAIDGLRFAVENLVENAIEHNERADLTVEVDIEERDESVNITISDNGSGISESELAAIRQGEEEDLVHGSGLGLWVVNWIVQRSAGELSFRESASGGAEIEIKLSRRA